MQYIQSNQFLNPRDQKRLYILLGGRLLVCLLVALAGNTKFDTFVANWEESIVLKKDEFVSIL